MMATTEPTKPNQPGQPRTFEEAVADGDCMSDEELERQARFTFQTLGVLLKELNEPPRPRLRRPRLRRR